MLVAFTGGFLTFFLSIFASISKLADISRDAERRFCKLVYA
jgi:hypothetical protein